MKALKVAAGLLAAVVLTTGCAPEAPVESSDEHASTDEKPFTSGEAVLLDVEFDGELTAPWQTNTTKLIKDQLFYSVGVFNGHESVGRLDRLVVSNVKRVSNGADGWMKVTYHAKLPVSWGHASDVPTEIALALPRKIGPKSLAAFTTKYSATCGEGEGHALSSANFWFYWRPEMTSCVLADEDSVRTTATATISTSNTSGKYPEYDQVWKDGALRVVAVFSKYEDYATALDDAGIQTFNAFVNGVKNGVGKGMATTPASVSETPGPTTTDVTFDGTFEGHKVSITAILVDSPKVANAAFDKRYAELTKNADVISYNGHAGLGANVNALAGKGTVVKDQYTISFMNGCDTYAYLDDKLAKRFAAANPGDPTGSKHLDSLTNAMPAYFHQMPSAALALIDALAHPNDPKTYEQIFAKVAKEQVVVATGEEDNTYQPPTATFAPVSLEQTLDKGKSMKFTSVMLPAGTYTVSTSELSPKAAGDVDLYVAVGYEPTADNYDQRPYLYGSDEEVTVKLDQPSKIFVMVQAYEDSPVQKNNFELAIEQ
ncbi:MAG: PPC domain-containing protein [Polyangiaceae bacterium]